MMEAAGSSEMLVPTCRTTCVTLPRSLLVPVTCCYLSAKVNSAIALKLEAVRYSKTLVSIYQAAWCHIVDDCNLSIYCRGNLKCQSF